MSSSVTVVLVAANLALLYLLLGMPLGIRRLRITRRIAASKSHVWSAIYPLGNNVGWSGDIVASAPVAEESEVAKLTLGWSGRDDLPIERMVALSDVVAGERFSLTVIDDSALDGSFWSNYHEDVKVTGGDGDVVVDVSRADRYRGAAFLIFRYFAMRRELSKLKSWAETGKFRRGGIFEHPLTQVGFAVLSAFILWPLFGLSVGGLVLAFVLTTVVALHELGHMAAFRLMGHRKVRMIFIPLLGGIAIGGRPYDSRFEVAFVALMGAGFSAFLIPIAIAASVTAHAAGATSLAALLATLAGCAAVFNFANLVPVWKFDGGQVLRQICGGPAMLALASFVLLSSFLAIGFRLGVPAGILLFAGAVFAVMSLITGGGGAKPRRDLKPIGGFDRLAIAAALLSVLSIHGYGVLWACALLVGQVG